MEEEFYALIITYTFGCSNERDSFRQKLMDKYVNNIVPLDESTYGIKNGDWKEESSNLEKFCKEIKIESNASVDLFCSGTHALCFDKAKKIKRIRIYENK